MRIYTIIGGVNGVGKSSLSGVLSAESSDLGIIIDTDRITAELGGDRIKGGKTAISLIDSCLEKGVNFTQETTLSGVRTLKTIKRARERDYFIRLYYVGVSSSDESIRRIRNRVEKGGHNIPTEDVQRRYSKRFEDLARVLPYCNEVRFFDNEKGQFKNRTRVAAGAEFIPRYDNRNYLGRIRYRAGFHYSNSYLRVSRSEENGYKGHGYNEYGASVGFGLPLIDNRSLVNLSFEYVKIRPELRTMIDEQYFRFTVNYTFNELWFFKRKVD